MLAQARAIAGFRYHFPLEEIDWIATQWRELLARNSFLTMGPYGEEFERTFAEYAGTRYGVAVSSGTAALEIILRSIGVEGKEVVVPTNTFAATAFAVIHAGGRPVFADCLPDLTVDPDDVLKRMGPDTAAVVTVHIGGLVSPATFELCELSHRTGIPLVEDCAHAHGSRIEGRHAGTFGVAGAFSFFSTKVMTTAEGGLVITSDQALYEKASLLRDQAKVEGKNYHEEIGSNWRMTEFQAILGLSQLRSLDASIERRREIARIYDQEFDGHSALSLLRVPRGVRHNYYKYVVFLMMGNREDVKARLNEKHIALGGYVYDLPCHRQPVFKAYGDVSLPRAEHLCARHICVPIYPSLSDDEARYVGASLREVLR